MEIGFFKDLTENLLYSQTLKKYINSPGNSTMKKTKRKTGNFLKIKTCFSMFYILRVDFVAMTVYIKKVFLVKYLASG